MSAIMTRPFFRQTAFQAQIRVVPLALLAALLLAQT